MFTLCNGKLDVALRATAPGSEVARLAWGTQADSAKLPGSTPSIRLCHAPVEGFKPALQRFFTPESAEPILFRGGRVGSKWEDAFAKYVLLMGVAPDDPQAERGAQATSAFTNLEAVLEAEGFAFRDVVRTWLYMDRILEWYDVLNRARDAFFESRHIFGGFVPASTGIGSANHTGSAIITGALAMIPKSEHATRAMLDSPLQCSALDYKSSFSRAAEIVTPAQRTVFVSGTASIEPGGATAHLDDPEKQIALTMDVISAILGTRSMTLGDTTRAIAYLKRPEYLPLWRAWLEAHHLPADFAQEVVADVCRDDLLFEVELDAVQTF